MSVNGQIHTPAVVTPEENPPVSIVCLTVLSYAGSRLVSGLHFTENTLQLSCKDHLVRDVHCEKHVDFANVKSGGT